MRHRTDFVSISFANLAVRRRCVDGSLQFVGTIDERVWRETLAPIYQQLVDEAQP